MQFISNTFLLNSTSQADIKIEKVWGNLAIMLLNFISLSSGNHALRRCISLLIRAWTCTRKCTCAYLRVIIMFVSADTCTCKSGIKSSDSR